MSSRRRSSKQEPSQQEEEEEAENNTNNQQTQRNESSKKRKANANQCCPHCSAFVQSTDSNFCSDCGMRTDLPFEHSHNEFLRQLQTSKAIASGNNKSTTTTSAARNSSSTPSINTSSLTTHEQEYERLSHQGLDHPRFQPAQSISEYNTTNAYTQMSTTFRGSEISLPPSQSLIQLIQSGKVKYPAWLIPKPIMEEELAKSGDVVLRVTADGRVGTTHQLSPKQIDSSSQLVEVLLCSIIPALINRPNALMDWVALVRSILQIENTHSWEIAQQYLNQVLASKVTKRSSFGDLDYTILSSVIVSSTSNPSQSNNKKRSRLQHEQSSSDDDQQEPILCKNFNWSKNGCQRGADCNFLHRCNNYPACASETEHSSKDCKGKSATTKTEV